MTNPLNEAGITATFAAIFDRLDRLEAIAAAQDTPSSPANAPEAPQGQTGDSDGTERIRVTKQNPPSNCDPTCPSELCAGRPDRCGRFSFPQRCDAVCSMPDAPATADMVKLWRKVQACERRVETDDSGAVSEHIRIRGDDGETSTYITRHACTFLTWLKDGEA